MTARREMTAVAMPAHAKLNVFLRVLGRRDDGYHDIETLVLPISLHDRVIVEPADGSTVDVLGSFVGDVPTDETNLVLRAVRALAAEAGTPDRVAHITIEKSIPVAAGLGGGSADAAATLLALNELWSTGLDRRALARVGSSVGSDVPALVAGEPVFARGRGELVDPVLVQSSTWVLKTFDLGVSSTEAYAWWDERSVTGPDPGALIAAAETGNDELLGSALFNDLQEPVVARHPEIGEAIDAFLAAGAYGAVMSGSGPTVAALCSFGKAQTIAEAVPGGVVVDAPPKPATPARIDPDPSGVV
jgi:4-diphosphocytidyl-2-C-methyl-D-erythritol kinase